MCLDGGKHGPDSAEASEKLALNKNFKTPLAKAALGFVTLVP